MSIDRDVKTGFPVRLVRLLSRPDLTPAMPRCATGVPYVVGPHASINVAMDWSEFDADGQATLMLSLLTRHGRVSPLA